MNHKKELLRSLWVRTSHGPLTEDMEATEPTLHAATFRCLGMSRWLRTFNSFSEGLGFSGCFADHQRFLARRLLAGVDRIFVLPARWQNTFGLKSYMA